MTNILNGKKELSIESISNIAKQMGRAARRERLRMMLFSGIEFSDFKGMAKCAKIVMS